MANAFVFPGGRLDDEDACPALLERLGPQTEANTALMEGVEDETIAQAHLVAAVRETFEESGILLAVRTSGEQVTPRAEWQDALNAGTRTFESILTEEDLRMSTDALAYFAHWVTPTFEPRRYDARFFLAVVPEGQEGQHDGKETTESLWITPSEALERHAAGELFVAPPQWQVLRQLQPFESTRDLLAWARGLERVPPIQPHRFSLDGAFALALPGDPEHPDTAPGAGQGAMHRAVLRGGVWRDA
jgi:8-oxo-dGTP pyrophosphatase MutT (NUDIX family)